MIDESAAGTLVVGRKVSSDDEIGTRAAGRFSELAAHSSSERGDLHERVTTAETSVQY